MIRIMKMKMFDHYAFWQRLIKFLGVLALLGTFVLVIWFYHLGILNDSNALKDFVNQHSVCGPLVFILVQIFQVVFPVIPGGVTTVAGFLIFDPILAFFYNYVGIVIGSIILFILVRLYGRKFILLFVDEKTFYKYEAKLNTQNYENFFIISSISKTAKQIHLSALFRSFYCPADLFHNFPDRFTKAVNGYVCIFLI